MKEIHKDYNSLNKYNLKIKIKRKAKKGSSGLK